MCKVKPLENPEKTTPKQISSTIDRASEKYKLLLVQRSNKKIFSNFKIFQDIYKLFTY